jgi:hypothetical protein
MLSLGALEQEIRPAVCDRMELTECLQAMPFQ